MLVVAKAESVPPETEMSPSAKSEEPSLVVKVRDREASLDVPPSLTSAAVIVIVGAVTS